MKTVSLTAMAAVLSITFCDTGIASNSSGEDAFCLAQAIYFEARNQPLKGQFAVGSVVLNRVEHRKFPNTVCGVVRQSKIDRYGNPIRNKCQFSFYCDGKPENILDHESWLRAFEVAELLLEGAPDITEGSVFYHTTWVEPYWKDHFVMTEVIDDHIFYKYD